MQHPVRRTRALVVTAAVLVAALVSMEALQGQEQSVIYMLAIDGQGKPVLDIKASDIAIREDVGSSTVVSVNRFGWPLKVTVLIDNGPRTSSALVPYRTGLKRSSPACRQACRCRLSPRHPTRAGWYGRRMTRI